MRNLLVSKFCLVLISSFTILLFCSISYADNNKLPIPRFVSIKSNEVNARNGPSIKSPIEWVFVKKGEVVEIIAEYDQWRQIRDIKGEGGWVHSSVLSGKRYVVVLGDKIAPLLRSFKDDKVVAHVSPEVRCLLAKCDGDFCKVECGGISGWLQRKLLWGIYKDEKF